MSGWNGRDDMDGMGGGEWTTEWWDEWDGCVEQRFVYYAYFLSLSLSLSLFCRSNEEMKRAF